jgi:S1-C subfamily serine protease
MRPGWIALLLAPLAFVGVPTASSDPSGHPERALVRIAARGCSAIDTVATGWLSDGGLVVTVAHAVRGSTSVEVSGVPARVVAVDNTADVAALVPAHDIDAAALSLAPVVRGPTAWLATFDSTSGSGKVDMIGVGAEVAATIDEPVDDTTYSRQAFSVSSAINRGDSGAPVVDGRGRVVGMMFATTRDGSPVSYAVSVDDIRRSIERVDISSPFVGTGRCN